jgi:hypothetical protein
MEDSGLTPVIYFVMLSLLFIALFAVWYGNYLESSLKEAEGRYASAVLDSFRYLEFTLSQLREFGEVRSADFPMAPDFPFLVSPIKRTNFLEVENGQMLTGTLRARETGQGVWWFDAAWDLRRLITIRNPNAQPLENFQVRLKVPWEYGMREDFADLRFTGPDGAELLPHYIETKTLENLVLDLHFDEGKGFMAFDYSGNLNDGEIQGATWTSNALYGGALSFDGVDDCVVIPNSPTINITGNQISIEVWVYIPQLSPAVENIILSKNVWSQYKLGFLSTNKFRFTLKNAAGNILDLDSGAITSTGWYHVVGTYDGSTAKIYLNGQLSNSAAFSGNIAGSTSDLVIGAYSNKSSFFRGIIDEVRIYDRALTSDEVQALYQNQLSWEAIVWVRLPYLAANGEENIWMYFSNPNASDASDPDSVFFFWDYFWQDPNASGRWEVYRHTGDLFTEFAWDAQNPGVVWLTKPVDYRGVAAFTKGQISYPFELVFRYKVENATVTPADGFAFAFDKSIENYRVYGKASRGGSLGLYAYDSVTQTNILSLGHAIEFDSYQNSDDPSSFHVALVETSSPSISHLTYVNSTVTCDNRWHLVRAVIQTDSVQVWIDGSLFLSGSYTRLTNENRTAFCAGTGYYMNAHLISRVRARSYVPSEPTVSFGTLETGPPRCGWVMQGVEGRFYPGLLWVYEDGAVLLKQGDKVVMRCEPVTFKAENKGSYIEVTYDEIWLRGNFPRTASTGRITLLFTFEDLFTESFPESNQVSITFRSIYFIAWKSYVKKLAENILPSLGYTASVDPVPFGWKVTFSGRPTRYTHRVFYVSVR